MSKWSYGITKDHMVAEEIKSRVLTNLLIKVLDGVYILELVSMEKNSIKINLLRPTINDCRRVENTGAYLRRALHNQFIDYLREEASRQRVHDVSTQFYDDYELLRMEQSEQQFEMDNKAKKLMDVLNTFDTVKQQIFYLRVVLNLKYAAIHKTFPEYSVEAIRQIISRMRSSIKDKFK